MFRFTLFDYTNSDGQTGVEIVEPIGFDGMTTKLIRNPLYKGVLMEFSDVEIEVDDKKGYKILTNAYEKLGVNAHVEIKIEYKCNHSGVFEELFYGRIGFKTYSQKCDDYCAAIVNIEPSSCIVEWKFREDVKVNLLTTKGFDGITDLTPYDKLGFDVEMPSKTIVLTNRAVHDESKFYTRDTVEKYHFIPFENVVSQELDVFQPTTSTEEAGIGDFYNGNWCFSKYYSMPTNTQANPNFFPEDLATFKLFNAQFISEYRLKGKFKGAYYNYPSASNFGIILQGLNFVIQKHDLAGNIIGSALLNVPISISNLETIPILDCEIFPGFNPSVNNLNGYIANFDIDFDVLIPYSQHQIFIYLFTNYNHYGSMPYGGVTGNLFVHGDTYLEITAESKYTPTTCKQFMINEVFSRITENITNDCMRVYSDYFGRTDAQPYASSADGCGALTSLTGGLFLRRFEIDKPQELQPIHALSFKETFQALNAIYNIGLQVEPDNNRKGFNLIRIEDESYFYQNEIMLDLGTIGGEIQIRPSEMYNIAKFGYEKWEAEEYNGLDEFLTSIEYKLDNTIKGEFNQKSKFIASGYTIEITRRKVIDNTKDWRYDNDTFIICLKRNGANLEVEQGAITGAENIIDPPTLYNVRISPVRNAMRWIRHIFQAFRKIDASTKMEFTTGDGNYNAKGEYTGACKLENATIAENQTIDASIFDDVSLVVPFTKAELIRLLDIPVSYKKFKEVRSNPLRLIKMRLCGKDILAYISKFEYNYAKGTADMELFPKF